MMTMPDNIRSIYFIGIGGIGMSALARHFHRQGVRVAGYDRDHSDLVQQLIDEGMEVHFEDNAELVRHPDLVICTPAIPDEHLQLTYVRDSGIPLRKRAEVLGSLSREMRCIAVAGTHGKTTTSTMIAYTLRATDVDCTAFIGGIAADFDGNYIAGESGWMVVEADEYDRSFLHLSPEIAVITSMDPDHLDSYGSYEAMCRGYEDFIRCILPGGMLIVHEDVWSKLEPVLDDSARSHFASNKIGGLTYGTGIDSNFRALNIAPVGYQMQFDVHAHSTFCNGITLGMAGRHNVTNATGALTTCAVMQHVFEVPDANWIEAAKSLSAFKGIKRRFEIVYAGDDVVIIDDYAHHPQEIEAAISAAREQFPNKRITGIFQPHLYSRTRDFCHEFAHELSALDVCILVDLYPAREQPIAGVDSQLIYDLVRADEKYNVGKPALIELLKTTEPEILLLMGAGDLDRMIPEIINSFK